MRKNAGGTLSDLEAVKTNCIFSLVSRVLQVTNHLPTGGLQVLSPSVPNPLRLGQTPGRGWSKELVLIGEGHKGPSSRSVGRRGYISIRVSPSLAPGKHERGGESSNDGERVTVVALQIV